MFTLYGDMVAMFLDLVATAQGWVCSAGGGVGGGGPYQSEEQGLGQETKVSLSGYPLKRC